MQKCWIRLIVIFLLVYSSQTLFAQGSYTISGTIKDSSTGERLIGATVRVVDLPATGASTNEYGFYSLSLPTGSYTLSVSYLGYKTSTQQIQLDKPIKLDLDLVDDAAQLDEVVISSVSADENLTSPAMGTETLNFKAIAKLPVLFGEKDILKTIQLLPGVKSNGEGSSGFSVRGGATDQNLILLDEAPVYNASHLLGFFSTFNSDAIKDASLIKGNSPAQYGGRLSSVLDIKMKDGNNQDYKVNGGIGLISSRLSVEGPIQKNKSSFIVSGRRTYADLFLKASPQYKDNKLFFYDLNAKANYSINDKNHIYLSGYFGRDVLGFGDTYGTTWGNTTGTIRWNHIANEKLFSNTSLIYSNYKYTVEINNNDNNFEINSHIEDWNLKQDFSYYANANNTIRFGAQSIYHTISPSKFSGSLVPSVPKTTKYSWENAVYVNDEYKVTDRFNISYGLRLSAFTVLGDNNQYNVYSEGIKVDSVNLSGGELGKTYLRLEPRFSANYRLNESSSIKAGFARNTQNLHLLSNSTSGNPTDQWIGSSYTVKPEISDQISIGYSKNFNDNNYELNVESYYKQMQNQIDYKNGADINSAPDVESELLFGKGRAYGLELMFKKKTRRLTGWVSYTLSKTERKIDGINNNDWYNARQDRTHDLAVVASYELNQKWSLSSLFVYSTGNAVTFPTGKYQVDGQTVFQYGARNGDRMPAYNRLDINATYEPNKQKRFHGSWSLGIYNVYGRQNAYSINFENDPDDLTRTQAVQTALFRWVPNITYNFKF